MRFENWNYTTSQLPVARVPQMRTLSTIKQTALLTVSLTLRHLLCNKRKWWNILILKFKKNNRLNVFTRARNVAISPDDRCPLSTSGSAMTWNGQWLVIAETCCKIIRILNIYKTGNFISNVKFLQTNFKKMLTFFFLTKKQKQNHFISLCSSVDVY
jgi:hypothetical protein